MMLYGRREDIGRLAASRAPLTILTGDTGVGKSELLAAAQRETEWAIAPTPRTLPASVVLQRILLEGLGAVLAEQVERTGRVQQLGQYLFEAVHRIVDERGQELVRVIGKEVLAFVRGRLGEEFGQATATYAKAFKDSVDDRLAVRLDSALDRPAAELVVALAGQVLDALGGESAVIALDAGERLADADLRLLADLSKSLPDSLRLRIAIATYSPEQRAMVDFLQRFGPAVAEIPLAALDEGAVGAWLTAAGQPLKLAADVTRVTAGYPLHIGDLILHLRGGGTVHDAPLQVAFGQRTEESWRTLEPEIAAHARKLCVFIDPLPLERTIELLDIDRASWGEAQDRLSHARIFSTQVNGQPWFHEQRRRYLVWEKLSAEERGAASAAGVELLEAMMVAENHRDRLSEFALMAGDATPLQEEGEQFRTVLDLDADELAICASLIELTASRDVAPAIEGDDLLRYARRVFGADGDLVAAFRRIQGSSLVHVIEDERMALTYPTFESQTITLLVAGRASAEFGRAPIPDAATVVFRAVIAPRLSSYLGAGYGVGSAAMSTLVEHAIDLRRQLAAPRFIAGRDAGPDLLLRCRYAGRPIYAHVSFEVPEARDAALQRLDGLQVETFGEALEVVDVFAHPVTVVPARRFLRAAKRLLGVDLRMSQDGLKGTRQLERTVSAEQRMHTRMAVRQIVRERSNTIERYAFRVERSAALAFHGNERHLAVIEILDAPQEVRRLDFPLDLLATDPFWAFKIEATIGSEAGQTLGGLSIRASVDAIRDDPAVEALNDYVGKAKEFNRHQLKMAIPLRAEIIEAKIQYALDQQRDDAEALAESGVFGDVKVPGCRKLEVELSVTDEGNGRIYLGPFWSGQVISRVHDGRSDEVKVKIGTSFSNDVRDLADREDVAWSRGNGRRLVAELLGYGDDDLLLTSE